MRVAAIVVAAGAGERFGQRKQFALLAGRTAAARAVEAARSVATPVLLVAPPGSTDPHGADEVVEGGATRSASVRAGLRALGDDVDVVVVHDAARPLASPALFASVVAALCADRSLAGAIPGLAVADTLKVVEGGRVVATLDRDHVVAAQTPQAFLATALRRAHADGADATDDAALVEALGETVVVVEGEAANRKLTTREDLAAMEAWLAR